MSGQGFWHQLVTLGERRYGELLGPAENRGPATVSATDGSDGDREVRRVARQVAAVPEPEFTEYIETAEHGDPRGAGVPSKTLKSGSSTPVALFLSARGGLVLVHE